MIATLLISSAAYRLHLEQPDFLPITLKRAAQIITDLELDWQVAEGEHPYLITEIDFELYHPAQRPVGGQMDWQLSGCATTALIALRLLVDAQFQGKKIPASI